MKRKCATCGKPCGKRRCPYCNPKPEKSEDQKVTEEFSEVCT